MATTIRQTNQQYAKMPANALLHLEKPLIPVKWFLSARLRWRQPRDVRHYPAAFIETVLQRHHFSAVVAIVIAFVFLVLVGFISDTRLFQLPAAASERNPHLAGKGFEADAISMIMHPQNPYVPTFNANLRFFLVDETNWYFGGGFDLTPFYPFEKDVVHWHQTARQACEPFGTMSIRA